MSTSYPSLTAPALTKIRVHFETTDRAIEKYDSLKKAANNIGDHLTADIAKLEKLVGGHTTAADFLEDPTKKEEVSKTITSLLRQIEATIDPQTLLDHVNASLKKHSESNTTHSTEEQPDTTEEIKLKNLARKLLKKLAALESADHKSCSHAHHNHTHAEGHDHDHDHDHGNGVVIDLDEAVHGFYAASKYLISVLQGNPSHVQAEFISDAQGLSTDTLHHLGQELIPDGLAEVIAAIGVSGIMLPLAFMAMKAGWEEMHHASHEIKDIKKHLGKLKDISNNLETIKAGIESPFITNEQHVNNSQIDVTKRALKFAKLNKMIGFSSFASGLSIGSKALSDIGLKISLGVQGALTGKGFLGMGSVVQTSTTAGVATTVLGAIGTFALGPLAGLFATTLGVYFTRKSSSKKNQLKKDYREVTSQLDIKNAKDLRVTGENPSNTNGNAETTQHPFEIYKNFIQRQGEKRTNFFTSFTRWNKAFMVGSGLYAASATTKAIVAGLALGGITAAASNPIGLGVITAVGTIGALGMGIASYCFITGHGKQGKYTGHTAGEAALIDRKLIVQSQVHNHTASPDNATEALPEATFALASASLERLNTRKDAIRSFLNEAAKANKTKKGTEKISSLQASKNGVKTSKPIENGEKNIKDSTNTLTIWKRLQGRALNVKNVEAYIKTPEHVLDFAKTDLEAEKNLLDAQLNEIKTLIIQASEAKPIEATPVPTGKSKKKAVNAFAAYTEKELIGKKTELNNRLEKTTKLLTALDDTQQNAKPTPSQLLEHWGIQVPQGEDEKINHLLAEYLFKQADKDTRNARGVLFETQLQASKLTSKRGQSTQKTRRTS